jgi:colanic acid/amylovoran biosynthesis glycosyltransferase
MQALGYLVSRYPAISHTFILREVSELRRRGWRIKTISVNPPDRPESALSDDERREAAATYVLKRESVIKAAATAGFVLFTRPKAFLRGVCTAIRLGAGAPAATLLRLCYFAEALLVGRWMHEHKIQHLHVHFATPAATVALLTHVIFGFRYSMTVHGPDEFYEVREYHLAEKIETASFICAIGNYCRSQLMKLSHPRHWQKFEVSPLGVDPEAFRITRQRNAESTPFQILCVGRLAPAKGQAILLQAAKRLTGEGRDIRVTFAGDGPDRQRLEAAAWALGVREVCEFSGAVNPDRVRDLYAAANAFVLPSFAEGIPVVLMEAMAMEVACISTTVNGIPELIDSRRNGILVPPSDADALANAIATLIDDPEYCSKLARAGREKVLADYNLARNITRLEAIFETRTERAA